MEWTSIIVITLLCLGLAAALTWIVGPPHRRRTVTGAPLAPCRSDPASPREGLQDHQRSGRVAAWRHEDRHRLVDDLAAFVERDLQLSETQRPAWQALIEQAKAALTVAKPLWQEPQAGARSALEQLEDLRQLFNTGLGALDKVEPAFRDFYGRLNLSQRARVDAAVDWSRRR